MQANTAEFEVALVELRRKWHAAQDEGTDYSIEIPETTLKESFNKVVEQNPDKPYVIHKDLVYTYAECNTMARKIANGLRKLGCEKGDRVVVYLSNGVNFVVAIQACFKLGLIAVNSNPFDLEYEAELRFNDCGAKVAFIDELSAEAVCAAAKGAPSIEYLVDCSVPEGIETNATSHKVVKLSELLANNDDIEPKADLNPDEIQVLQYTGGTTGVIKGCCVSHRNYLYHAYCADQYYSPVVSAGEWSVSLGLPLSHAYAFTSTITASVMNAGTIIFADSDRPTIDEALCNIEKYKATVWPTVPAILYMALSQPDLLTKYDLSSLKCIFSGSAPLPVSIIEAFERVTGARISEGYGLTEAVTTLTLSPFGVFRPGKVGIPFAHIDVLIVDMETGLKVLPANERGEIIARGPQITKGYWNKPEETAASYHGEWLYTGDIGFFDEEGILSITGRIKDMIIVSGFNVYPTEIDELLSAHPDILESTTIGIPHEKKGEVPKSFVVKRSGAALTEEDIQAFLHEKLLGYKVPQVVQFLEVLPRTKTAKVDKIKLQEIQ